MIMEALPAGDPLRDEVHEISEAGERATTLTRQLLAFSRKQVIAPKLLNLNTVVSGVVQMLRRLDGEDIDIVTDLAPVLDTVFVDPGQMEQVLMNLATNARDAMPQGGKLIIQTQNVHIGTEYASTHIEAKPGAYVRLAVTDSGEGMAPETLEHAFEPFFTTKPRGRGPDLGWRRFMARSNRPRAGSGFTANSMWAPPSTSICRVQRQPHPWVSDSLPNSRLTLGMAAGVRPC
jgi:signal transduction histidine kinase